MIKLFHLQYGVKRDEMGVEEGEREREREGDVCGFIVGTSNSIENYDR
jgi:hypothetical protein